MAEKPNTFEPVEGYQRAMPPSDPAAYDAWFREQVGLALKEAEDPDAVWYSHEEVMAQLDEMSKEWRELVIPKAPFLVVYQITNETIHLLQFLHGAEWRP